MSHQAYLASTSLSQRWLSEVEATGTLINSKTRTLISKLLAPLMANWH
jgi:hypothetical protein